MYFEIVWTLILAMFSFMFSANLEERPKGQPYKSPQLGSGNFRLFASSENTRYLNLTTTEKAYNSSQILPITTAKSESESIKTTVIIFIIVVILIVIMCFVAVAIMFCQHEPERSPRGEKGRKPKQVKDKSGKSKKPNTKKSPPSSSNKQPPLSKNEVTSYAKPESNKALSINSNAVSGAKSKAFSAFKSKTKSKAKKIYIPKSLVAKKNMMGKNMASIRTLGA